jgi:RNA-directed DNA polymerase
MALDGMEQVLRRRFASSHPQARRNKVNLIRYADDFVVTGASKELLEKAKAMIEDFLRQRGLTLSEQKTKIVHIEEGFDFLGWNVRKYDEKLLIKPAKKNVQAFTRKVRAVIRENRTATQEKLIARLNPIIRGWANYHRNQVASDTFGKVDHAIWQQLWQWACRRHPHKPLTWVKDRYFAREGGRNWVFRSEVKGEDGKMAFVRLVKASDVAIRRHRKIKAEANPFDPAWDSYFAERRGLLMQRQGRRLPPKLWEAQKGLCPVCREPITTDSGWDIRLLVPRALGGTTARANLALLHPSCAWQVDSRTRKGELSVSVKRGLEEA